MKIIISNSSAVPIYEQIKEMIKNQILSNDLQENEMLPSIRTLAQDIKISVMTIKKAYDELEKEGYIVSKQGKGSFVCPMNIELYKENAKKQIEDYLLKAIDLAKQIQISKKEIQEIIDLFYGSESYEKRNRNK